VKDIQIKTLTMFKWRSTVVRKLLGNLVQVTTNKTKLLYSETSKVLDEK